MQVVVYNTKTNRKICYHGIVSIIRQKNYVKLLNDNGRSEIFIVDENLQIIIENLEWF